MIPVPPNFTPGQRTVLGRLVDITKWQNLRISPIEIDGRVIRDEADLIEMLGRADVETLTRLDAALAAEQDRVKRERAAIADHDRSLADAERRELEEAERFRRSPEGRQERQIELLEQILTAVSRPR
jgi:hypothetical protein